MLYLKKYLKYGIAALVGIVVAVCSWLFIVEPSYPYLLLDVNSPVQDDVTGIGYLPIEITGASADGAIVKRMCNVPEIYGKYAHNVPKSDSFMSGDSAIGQFVLKWSWIIVAVPLLILFGYMIYNNVKRGKAV